MIVLLNKKIQVLSYKCTSYKCHICLSNRFDNFWFHADLLNFAHLHSERIRASKSTTFPKLSDVSSVDVDIGDDDSDDSDDSHDVDDSDGTCKNFLVS